MQIPADTLKYLSALGGVPIDEVSKYSFCFQIFSDVKKSELPIGLSPAIAQHKTGSIEHNIDWLKDVNRIESGGFCGVYTVVNQTDGLGRKAENVVGVRALFIELDYGVLKFHHFDDFASKFGASIVVESSPGKCHVYWLVEPGVVPLDKFTRCQLLLRDRFEKIGADASAKDLPRVLRVPGFTHLKNPDKPWTVRLHHCDGSKRYKSVDSIFELIGIDAEFIKAHPSRSASILSAVTEGDFEEYIGAKEHGNPPRNTALSWYVFNLFRKYRINRDVAIGAAWSANRKNIPPMEREEVVKIVESAWKKFQKLGGLSTFDIAQNLLLEHVEIEIEPDGKESYDEHNFKYNEHKPGFASPVSDACHVERIVQKYRDKLKVSPSTGVYFYEDAIWKNNAATKMGEVAFRPHYVETVARLRWDATLDSHFITPSGAPDMKGFKAFMKEVLSYNKFTTVIKEMALRTELLTDFRKFDTAVGVVPTLSGVVDLASGKILPEDSSRMFTKQLQFRFNPNAVCPKFEKFISEIMVGEDAMISYLQKICGVILAGDTSNQCLYLLWGRGGNGKSKFLKIMNAVLGDFSGELSTDALVKNYGAVSVTVLSSLAQAYGKRLMAVGEVEEGAEWNESLVKALSGDDVIVAKYFHKDPFEYRPTYSMMIRANHMPKISGGDKGITDRFRIIHFKARFRDAVDAKGIPIEDKHVEDAILNEELSGVFNWMAEGYKRYLKDGLIAPESAQEAKESYTESHNPWQEFLDVYTVSCSTKEGMYTEEVIAAGNKYLSNSQPDQPMSARLTKDNCRGKLTAMGVLCNKPKLTLLQESEGKTRVFKYGIKLTEAGKKLPKDKVTPIKSDKEILEESI